MGVIMFFVDAFLGLTKTTAVFAVQTQQREGKSDTEIYGPQREMWALHRQLKDKRNNEKQNCNTDFGFIFQPPTGHGGFSGFPTTE